jgi:hypothetical protein
VHWLNEMPTALVAAHSEMLGRLEAEEALASATQVAIGGGLKKGSWIGRQWSRWSRDAAGVRGERAARATPADLSAAGIGMRVVKPEKRKA